MLAIECKSDRGRLTVEQSDWLDTLNAAGVPAVVVRPADYDDMIATITSGSSWESYGVLVSLDPGTATLALLESPVQ